MLKIIKNLLKGIIGFFAKLWHFLFPPQTSVPPVAKEPTVHYIGPTDDVIGNNVVITYNISDPDSNLLDVHVYYSVDGTHFSPATPKINDVRHSGAVGLSTTPAGIDYHYVWNWQLDIPQPQISNVCLKVMATDATGLSHEILSTAFNISLQISTPPPPPANIPTRISILGPTTNILTAEATIIYELFDPDNDPANIGVEFSVNGGAYVQATPLVNDPKHNGISNLATSQSGNQHRFIWDWQTDIRSNSAVAVNIKITPSDKDGTGAPAFSANFDIIDTSTPPPPIGETTPLVEIVEPELIKVVGSDLLISYNVYEPQSNPVDIEVSYTIGGVYETATPISADPRHDGITTLSTSPTGQQYSFVWDWHADINQDEVSNVIIRIMAISQHGSGQPATTQPLTISLVQPPATPPLSNVPEVFILSPFESLPASTEIPIIIKCLDTNSEPVDIEMSYAVDGGNFSPATPKTSDSNHEGVLGLSTTPEGALHTFVWDNDTDLSGTHPSHLQIQAQAMNSRGNSFPALSGFISIIQPVTPPAAGGPFSINIENQESDFYGQDLLIQYTIIEPNFEIVDVEVKYRVGGGQFELATPIADDPRHTGETGLETSPTGILHGFSWDWLNDISANEANDVVIQVNAILSSGISVSSQSAPVNIGVSVQNYQLTVIEGNQIDATPSLRLPEGSIKLELKNHGIKATLEEISVFVMEGGGGFPTARPPASEQNRSQVQLTTDGNGQIIIPEFILGSSPAANRLLVQHSNAQTVVTILGSYTNTQLVAIEPASTQAEEMVAQIKSFTGQLQDANYPNARIEGVRIAVEMSGGGGWLRLPEGFGRSMILETRDNYIPATMSTIPSSVSFSCIVSARLETTDIELSLMDYPVGPILTFTLEAKKLHMLSYRSGTAGDEDINDTSTDWLSSLSRWAVTNYDSVPFASPIIDAWGTYQILAESKQGQSELYPEYRTGWGGNTSLLIRPTAAGRFKWELNLPDFPDDNVHELSGTAVNQLQGQSVGEFGPPWYAERRHGSTRDDDHGLELQLESGDIQYVGPNSHSPHPFRFSVITKLLQPPDSRRLVGVKIFCKVRVAPMSSEIDDPTSSGITAGVVGTSPGSGVNELELSVPHQVGVHPLTLWYTSPELNYDNHLEITARVTVQEKDANGIWQTYEQDSDILAHAIFFAPRVTITKKDGSDYFEPGAESLIPTPIVDESGNAVTPDSDREYYIELRAEDYGNEVDIGIFSGSPIKITKVETKHAYTLYRSKPVVFYLENPETFGQYDFASLPDSHEYIRLRSARWFYVNARDAIQNNTNHANYWSPVRPFSFLNMSDVGGGNVRPSIPKPKIVLKNLITQIPEQPIIVENNQAKLQIIGSVYDTIADLTPGTEGHITELIVGTKNFPLNAVNESNTEFRPNAWRGDFDIKIPLAPGIQILEIKAENKLGKTNITQIKVDFIDSRNDFDNPDASEMKAIVHLLSDPDIQDNPGLVTINYRMPTSRDPITVPRTIDVDVNSMAAAPSPQIEDTLSIKLKSVGGLENNYTGLFLAVPPNVDQQKLDALRAAGAPIIKHTPGTRLQANGQNLPHINGTIDLHYFIASHDHEIRVLVKQSDGTFEEREQVQVGEEFTVEMKQYSIFAYKPVQLIVGACDQLGQIFQGESRLLTIELDDGPNQGWLRMNTYVDANGNMVNASTIMLSTDFGEKPPNSKGLLCTKGHGLLRIDEFLGKQIGSTWAIINNPIRQEINDSKVPSEPYPGAEARNGAMGDVICATGEYSVNEADARLIGRGLNISFERTYLSYNTYDGPFGLTWNHSYNCWFTKPDDNHFHWICDSGIVYEFEKDSNSDTFITPRGLFVKLTVPNQSTCILEWPGGLKQVYLRNGLTSKIWMLVTNYDHAMNGIYSQYNQTGLLASITDALKQKLLLRYDDHLRIKSIGDATGRKWKYKYHEAGSQNGSIGNLKSFCTPKVTSSHNKFLNGKERHFDYENSPSNLLTHNNLKAIQDGQGSLSRAGNSPISPVVVMTFTDQGRVDKQFYGNGSYDFTYGQNHTAVSNRRNHTTEYTFASSQSHPHLNTLPTELKVPDVSGTNTYTFAYNDDGNAVREEGPLHAVTEYTYDSSSDEPRRWNSLLEKKEYPRNGNPDVLINTVGMGDFTQDPPQSRPTFLFWKWAYESRYQKVKTAQNPLGQVTTFYYDYELSHIPQNHGNLCKLEHPALTTGANSQAITTRITQWWYNNYGQPVKEVNPVGVITRFEYYKDNDLKGGMNAPLAENDYTPTSRLGRIITDDVDSTINRSSSLTTPEIGIGKISYDHWGNNHIVSDNNDNQTLHTYNELNQLIEKRNPGGLVLQYWYNINNNVIKQSLLVRDMGFPNDANTNPKKIVFNEYEYDRLGNIITEIIDSTGLAFTKRYEYDHEDNLYREFSPKANATSNPDPNNFVEYHYDPQNRKIKLIQAPNVSPRWEKEIDYDKEGNIEITSETMSAIGSRTLATSYEYNSWGQQINTVDAYGNKKVQMYDALGRITYMAKVGNVDGEYPTTQPQILSEAINYLNEAGDKAGTKTKMFRWKKQGNTWQKEVIDNGRMITRQEFDGAGNVVATVSVDGKRKEFRYNGRGNLRATGASGLGESSAIYDGEGNVLSITIPSPTGGREIVVRRSYDNANHLTSHSESGKETENKYYDSLGNLRLQVDGKGNRVYQDYDNAGQLIKVTREIRENGRYQSPNSNSPNSLDGMQILSYSYDANGNPLSTKDRWNRTMISHTYDSRNERRSTTLPDDAFPGLNRPATGVNTYQFSYYENSRIKEMITPDGIKVEHDFDFAGRLSARRVSSAPGFSPTIYGTTHQMFKYDGADRCIYSSDNNGFADRKIEVEHQYDSVNNLWSDRQKHNIFTYNQDIEGRASFRENGELALLHYNGNSAPTIRYSYGHNGRMEDIFENDPIKQLADFQYNRHYLSRKDMANNHSQVIHHNNKGVLERFLHLSTVAGVDPEAPVQGRQPNEKVMVAEEYLFDNCGYPYIIKDLKRNKWSLNFYDSLGRLKTVLSEIDGDDVDEGPKFGKWLVYDSHGNSMTSHESEIVGKDDKGYDTINTTGFLRIYNASNQVGRSVEQFVKKGQNVNIFQIFYDRRGNLIRDHQYEYKYDVFNRLVKVLDLNSGRAITSNYFDTFDRRVLKDNTRFVYYQGKILEEHTYRHIQRYMYDENGVFMFENDMTATGGPKRRKYIHKDRMGNAQYLTTDSGEIIEQYEHHPLTGLPRFKDENGEERAFNSGNPFLFQGMYYDRETQLYCVGPRFYHPKFRMMMQRDPEGIDFDSNAYSFSRNNPNSYIDPSGRLHILIWLWITGAALGAGFTLVRQGFLHFDGDKDAFNNWEVLTSALIGMALAPFFFVVPELGLVMGAYGIYSSIDEFGKEHYLTCAFDAFTSIFGMCAALKGGTLIRAVQSRKYGYSDHYLKSLTFKEKVQMLVLSEKQYKKVLRENRANNFIKVFTEKLDNFARLLGVDPETQITYTLLEINETAFANHPRFRKSFPTLRYNIGQAGMKKEGMIYIDLAYFLPTKVRATFMENPEYFKLPPRYNSNRHLYPSPRALLCHEVAHLLFGAKDHARNWRMDPSTVAIYQFWFKNSIIDRTTAFQLTRSINQLPPTMWTDFTIP